MDLNPIKKNESFFVEGTGKAIIADDNGKMGYLHLQNAEFNASSTMEDILGGETNTPLYSYQSDKSFEVTFTNASMDAQTVALTQGVAASKTATVFAFDEEVTVAAGGTVTLAHAATADLSTLILADDEGNVVAYSGGKVNASYAGKTLKATYAYTTTSGAVGVDVKTVSVPGYVQIFFKSKAMKQKNGRIVRMFLTIYKARSDGSLDINLQHKNAFAPELKFNIVDPERADGKYWSFSVVDVTDEEQDNKDVISPVDSAGEAQSKKEEKSGQEVSGGEQSKGDSPQ